MFENVLILSASAGAGHVSAARALERAFVEMGVAREVRNLDTLQHTNPVFRNLYSKTYIDMVNKTPELLGWIYDRTDDPALDPRPRLEFDKLNARPFIKLLETYRPEITICTHFLPAEIISWLKSKERLATRQAIVVTDFDVHAMWLCPYYEQYFVALDEARAHLEKLGVPPNKISVTGIPIDPEFARAKDQAAMRLRHGLQPDRTTILVSAGGFGVGPVEKLLASLRELRHPAQVLALCGRNEALKQRVEALVKHKDGDSRVAFHVVGFTDKMDEYMAASDLILGKPGGLTTSEALARGLAFVIANPIPGQEERNSDHLLEEGAAIRCNNPPVLAYKIDRLLDDPVRLAAMRGNASRLAHPRAAYEIVERLLELHRADWPVDPRPAKAELRVRPRRKGLRLGKSRAGERRR
jgi:processive 1,2-diacylglycerol beta-glucosyltransferase